MKRSGLSMAAMVATVVMVLTVSTYAITARTVNPVVGLSFQGTTAVCHAKCFAGSDNDNIQATLTLYCGANRLDSWDGSGKGTISLSGTCRVETGKQYNSSLSTRRFVKEKYRNFPSMCCLSPAAAPISSFMFMTLSIL